MTYAQLLIKLLKLSEEQLNQPVVALDEQTDETRPLDALRVAFVNDDKPFHYLRLAPEPGQTEDATRTG